MENLTQLLNRPGWTSPNYDIKDYIPAVLAGDRWDLKVGDPAGTGPLYAMPMGWETYIVTYNKTAFAKAHISPHFTSLQNLAADAAKLKGWNGSGSYGICVRGLRNWGTIHPDYMSLLTEWGGTDLKIQHGHVVAAMDSPQAIAMTNVWAKMVKESGEPGFVNYDWPQCQTDLGAGKAAMLYDADILGMFTNLPGAYKVSGNLGFAPPPPGPNGKISSNEWIWSLGLNKQSHHKLAAWLFLQWMTSKQHDLFGGLKGLLVDTPRLSVEHNPAFIRAMNKISPGYLKVFGVMSKVAAIRFMPEPDFFQMATEWAGTLQSIVEGSTSAASGLTRLANSLDPTLASIKVTGAGKG
jgi:multiple sugar transport system substrate-binding protein